MRYLQHTQNDCDSPRDGAESATDVKKHELLDLETVSSFATWIDTALADLEEQFRCLWTADSLRRQLGRKKLA